MWHIYFVLHSTGHHSLQLTSHNPWLHMQKSNQVLSPSVTDKDGLAPWLEADISIYLSYSINRKPIACLLCNIKTDVGSNMTLHHNQIDAFLWAATATDNVMLRRCGDVCFQPELMCIWTSSDVFFQNLTQLRLLWRIHLSICRWQSQRDIRF